MDRGFPPAVPRNWIEVTAFFEAPPPDWSPFIDAFDCFGCPETLQTDSPAALTACLEEVPGVGSRVAGLEAALRDLGVARVQAKVVPDQDWSALWREFFKTRRVGERLVLSPSWENFEGRPRDVVVTLDPGQAFGTGDHPTTRLCLALLEQADPAGKAVADVGCGSGILAIAAAKLGAKRVFASDVDEQSVEIARQNAAANGVEVEFAAGAGFEPQSFAADIVLSNIISATLILLAPAATAAVKAGGVWIVSGIIAQNWPEVRAAAERGGFQLERVIEEDGWIAASFRALSQIAASAAFPHRA